MKMNKFLLLLAFSLLIVGVASAAPIPCSIGIDVAVSGSTEVVCGGLTFSNFEVLNPTGGASGIVDILSATFNAPDCPGEVCLSFNPNLAGNEDEQFFFTVSGGVNDIDMSVGGSNATIQERACANPIPTTGTDAFLCTNGLTPPTSVAPLGQITVTSGQVGQPISSAPFATTSPIYIFKNIETQNVGGVTGQLSEFTQSFAPSGTPEPVSMVLLGSGLLGLGLLRRRSRKS
jgi:hypothetical protein